jgi:CHASE2 domain-containing sensor protein
VLGPECLKGPVTISLGAEAASGLFGFVNITRDRDGAVRRERRAFQDAEGKARSTLSAKAAGLLRGGAGRAASDGKPFLVDFSVDPEKLPRVSWKDLAAVLDEGEGCFRGKLVLVGAEYAASGDVSYRVPHRRGGKDEVSGLVLNALSVNTLLEGARISDAPRMAAAVLLGSTLLLAGFWFLGRPKSATWWAVCLVLCGLYVASSFVVSREFGIFLPLAGPGVACLLSAGGMLWVGIKTGL